MSVLKVIAGVGSVLRQAGRAVDSLGASMQGRYAYKETRAPTYRNRTCVSTYVLVVLQLTQGRRAVATHQTLQEYMGKRPTLAPDAFVAPNASVIGNVTLGKGSSVWYGAILRGESTIVVVLSANRDLPFTYVNRWLLATAGDVNAICVGANTNIQDGTIVHVARHNPKGQEAPTVIGDNVTIGAKLVPACLQRSALPAAS